MTSQHTMSQHYDVVIAGAGIIGLSTALFLRERGLSVVVFDKGEAAYEQSTRNWGWMRTVGQDMAELELALTSRPLWQQWAVEGDFGFRKCGLVSVADNDEEWAALQEWLRLAAGRGLDTRALESAETARLLPQFRRRWTGALFAPGDAGIEPDLAMRFLEKKVRAAGVSIVAGDAVRSIDITGGKATAVETETGRVTADRIVIAAGAWSRWLCSTVGIIIPQLKVMASVLRTTPVEDGPEPNLASTRYCLRRRKDGGYTVARRNSSLTWVTPDSIRFIRQYLPNYLKQKKLLRVRAGMSFFSELQLSRRFGPGRANPFEDFRACDPAPDIDTLKETFEHLRDDAPMFRSARIAASWAGIIDVMPDALPILSPVAQYPGLFLATGFSAHGFGIGPASGKLMADIVMGDAAPASAASFRLERFHLNND
ncbi:NAD(P)/FAD-dependent oxidoreductase [Acetobacter fallax]|uniref:FAD-dependent oxidoreductase n=1 Tax=Acetobacter fallax TaxID=1737473 RepID=A0ABX0KDE3_9PROT|nr:FAD-binding oxidoreductase [Acetobacter fallax]NHO33479.1 FAD-dependent oxidoreductase [Acetobacter fallax]NHO37113.1 FAD-dependent oxidoreductase [Acetobacter fallax]